MDTNQTQSYHCYQVVWRPQQLRHCGLVYSTPPVYLGKIAAVQAMPTPLLLKSITRGNVTFKLLKGHPPQLLRTVSLVHLTAAAAVCPHDGWGMLKKEVWT